MSKPKRAPEWMYDGELWAELAKQAGFEPYHTESSARRAFEYCADLHEALQAENAKLKADIERLREALVEIDARDPGRHIYTWTQTEMGGLVLRIGEIARAALAAARGETEKDTDR